MHQPDAIPAYQKKLTPMLRGLQRAAYAMTGNRSISEYALHTALVEAYMRRSDWHGRLGFREELLRALRAVTLTDAARIRRAEQDWPGLLPDDSDPVIAVLTDEDVEVQRVVALRFGCGLTPREIALLTGMRQDAVREIASSFRLQAERSLKRAGKPIRQSDKTIAYALRRNLNREGDDVLLPGQVLRTFEQDAQSMRPPRHLIRKTFKWIFGILWALLLAAMFWGAMVLMHYA